MSNKERVSTGADELIVRPIVPIRSHRHRVLSGRGCGRAAVFGGGRSGRDIRERAEAKEQRSELMSSLHIGSGQCKYMSDNIDIGYDDDARIGSPVRRARARGAGGRATAYASPADAGRATLRAAVCVEVAKCGMCRWRVERAADELLAGCGPRTVCLKTK